MCHIIKNQYKINKNVYEHEKLSDFQNKLVNELRILT